MDGEKYVVIFTDQGVVADKNGGPKKFKSSSEAKRWAYMNLECTWWIKVIESERDDA